MKISAVGACVGLVLSSLSAFVVAQSNIACQMPEEISGASYQIVSHSGEAGTVEEVGTETLLLLRSANRVMHIHPAKHTADMWERNAHGGVHFNRFYDAHQRGIEYYQGVAAEPASKLSWEQAYQLIPSAVLSDNDVQSEELMPGCARVESYRYSVDGAEYTLEWLPEQQLVLHLAVNRGQYRLTWVLDSVVVQPDRLSEEVQNREAYITIDYADLGDQESDPFFRALEHGSAHH